MRSDEFRKKLLSGLVLHERIEHGVPRTPVTRSRNTRHRLRAWRSQFDFQPSWFEHRLSLENLTSSEFDAFVSESESAFAQRVRSIPSWVSDFGHTYRSLPSDTTIPSIGESQEPLRPLLQPFISAAITSFERAIATLDRTRTPLPHNAADLGALLIAPLIARLTFMSLRAVTLEVNIARISRSVKGDSPQERFANFVCGLSTFQGARRLFAHYPVLLSQFHKTCDQWTCFSRDVTQHLVEDWDAISARFGAADWGHVVQIESADSDPHRGGRRVLIFHFESGQRLVYKPRSLAVEVHFQDLLNLLNGLTRQDWFHSPEVIDRGDHGWVEYVQHLACPSWEDLKKFFVREGGLLAVLYALAATDFHSENVMANGAFPVLIDLEGLFHTHSLKEQDSAGASLTDRAVSESLLASGLLPFRLWQTHSSDGLDVSGMGGGGEQAVPFKVSAPQDLWTDIMRFEPRQFPMSEKSNLPIFKGEKYAAAEFQEEVVSGFSQMYVAFMAHRVAIMKQVEKFHDDEIRCLLVPTQNYGVLIRDAFHPDMLRHGLDRDRWLDRIWNMVSGRPILIRTMSAQRSDLENNDVPMFVTTPGSADLLASNGERIPDFLSEPPLAHVSRRIEKMSEEDLDRQIWCITASLASSKASGHTTRTPTSITRIQRGLQPSTPPKPSEFLACAQTIGARLISRATRSSEGATWLGMTMAGRSSWAVAPTGTELYDGTPGIALFLAWLGAIANDPRCTDFARAALEYTRRRLHWDRPQCVGAFCGLAGWIYTLVHLGALWNDETLFEEALVSVAELPSIITNDGCLDLMSGVAGCALVLCSFESLRPDPHTREALELCARRLVERALPAGKGVGWLTTLATNVPWTGCSHGAAGFTWALLRVAAVTQDVQFRILAESSLAYERGLYSEAKGNWPDLRNAPDQENYMVAWCHGASGIGLARMQTLDVLDDELIRTEIDCAIRATLACGSTDNLSLCHGELGNLDILLEAGRLIDPAWLHYARSASGQSLECLRAGQVPCGVPCGVETPGLMTGLAGIGYGLLRLAHPDVVPSVLAVQLPRLSSETPQPYLSNHGPHP